VCGGLSGQAWPVLESPLCVGDCEQDGVVHGPAGGSPWEAQPTLALASRWQG
jgi:hypothetical protein